MNQLLRIKQYQFTEEDKTKCLPLAKRLIALAQIAMQRGLLALEKEIQHEEFLLRTGLLLVIDGRDPLMVEDILGNYILMENYKGYEFLKRVMIMEGVLAIQQGNHPNELLFKLCAFLGEKEAEKQLKEFEESTRLQEIEISKLFLHQWKQIPHEECIAFDRRLQRLPDYSLQKIIQGIESPVLFTALLGCSRSVIEKCLHNMSQNLGRELIGYLQGSCDIEYILADQKKVEEMIQGMIERMEIIDYDTLMEMQRDINERELDGE